MGDDPARPRTDPDVLDRLVSGHREFLAYVERRVGSRELAEDILQDAFVRAVEKLPGVAIAVSRFTSPPRGARSAPPPARAAVASGPRRSRSPIISAAYASACTGLR